MKGRRASRQPDRPRDMLTRYFAHVSVELSEVERPSSIEVSMNGTYVGNLALMSMPDCGVVYGEIRLDSVCSTLRGKSTRVILETLESWLQVEIIKVSRLGTMTLESRGVLMGDLGRRVEAVPCRGPEPESRN